MDGPIVTLTTDFGTSSHFVAAMKGVLLGINPAARILDLSHDIPPFDLRHAAFFLAGALPYFPMGTLHVVVVDPEVGTDRDVLCIDVAGQRLLAPDNGCWTRLGEPTRVLRVTQPRFWRPAVSSTFHGRDVFAPVAAHLSLGVEPAELGPEATRWRRLEWPTPPRLPDGVAGEIAFVDHFGNLITNIPGDTLPPLSTTRVAVGEAEARPVRTYADGCTGELVALVSSGGLLEVAVVQGSAARRLSAGVGVAVRVRWSP
ncbi:MAG: SAM-dependent chlorinase/fluorinase [Gemmataceae bacterium]